MMLLAMLLAFQNSAAFPLGDRVKLVDAATSKTRRIQGHPLTMISNGIILRRDAQLILLDLDDAAETTLPPLDAPFIQLSFPNVDRPVLASLERVYVLNPQSEWQSFDCRFWVEWSSDQAQLGRFRGMAAIGYELVQLSQTALIAYDPKSGQALEFDLTDGSLKRSAIGEDLHLTRSGSWLFWMGHPEEGYVSLSSVRRPLAMIRKVSVSRAGKDARIYPDKKGRAWIATFPDGFRELLASWKSSTMPVNLALIDANQGREILTRELDNLPVTFAFGTSSSGSPRLNASLDFRLMVVPESGSIACLTRSRVSVIDREGVSRQFGIEVDSLDQARVRQQNDVLVLVTPEGCVSLKLETP